MSSYSRFAARHAFAGIAGFRATIDTIDAFVTAEPIRLEVVDLRGRVVAVGTTVVRSLETAAQGGALQPFAFYQLGGGTYLRAAPIWVYNFENDDYSVPLGIGIGQVIKKGKTVYNLFAEPQFSVADEGPGQPEWQLFVGFNRIKHFILQRVGFDFVHQPDSSVFLPNVQQNTAVFLLHFKHCLS